MLKERVLGLDILRTIAILSVIHLHGYKLLGGIEKYPSLKFLTYIEGVDVFFVLSGFLVGKQLLEFENKPTKNMLLKYFIKR